MKGAANVATKPPKLYTFFFQSKSKENMQNATCQSVHLVLFLCLNHVHVTYHPIDYSCSCHMLTEIILFGHF